MQKRTTVFIEFLLILSLCILVTSCSRSPVIYLVGDSTMSYKPDEENPERGWGMFLSEYFDESVQIENHAMNGRSSRSFIYEGRWDSVMIMVNKGDFIVLQFGHNDGVIQKTGRYCTPEEYRYNMTRFILDARAKSVNPILCTSVQRRKFDSTGTVIKSHGVYPEIIKELAAEYSLPLVDMQQMSEELIMHYGVEGSKVLFLHIAPGESTFYPEGKVDNTHFSKLGARKMAGLFIQGLVETNHELSNYIKSEKYE